MPRISVLMPVYNTRPEHLREAMDSILSQTFTDFEFLILNDASTDPRVEEVVKSFSDPRIVYAVNERNLGISGSRNRLLDMAKGEYLAVMDHDDFSFPTRLEKQLAFFAVFYIKKYAERHYDNRDRQKNICMPVEHTPRAASVVYISEIY